MRWMACKLTMAAAILLSGSNYAMTSCLAQFFNLAFTSSSTYFRVQRLYLLLAIDEWWGWIQKQLVEDFLGQSLVIGGDGQCDYPGFNAKNLCYFFVEVNSNYIIHVEILDKRHVGFVILMAEKMTNVHK